MKILQYLTFAFLGLFGVNAFAAVDVAVTTALADAKTDIGVVGGAVLVALVAVAAFRYIKRAL